MIRRQTESLNQPKGEHLTFVVVVWREPLQEMSCHRHRHSHVVPLLPSVARLLIVLFLLLAVVSGSSSSHPSQQQQQQQQTTVITTTTVTTVTTTTDTDDPPRHAKGLYVDVVAAWGETPLLQEGIELVARGAAAHSGSINSHALINEFTLLRRFAPGEGDHRELEWMTQEEQYHRLHHVLFASSSSNTSVGSQQQQHDDLYKKGLIEVELASRVYSPAVAAHYSYASSLLRSLPAAWVQYTCPPEQSTPSDTGTITPPAPAPFLVVYSTCKDDPSPVSSVQELVSALNAAAVAAASACERQGKEAWRRELLLGKDAAGFSVLHAHPNASELEVSQTVVVLLGRPACSRTFALLNGVEKWLSSQSSARFLFGHLPLSSAVLCSGAQKDSSAASDHQYLTRDGAAAGVAYFHRPLRVHGYGAVVDMRNMEYKVLNEEKAAPPPEASSEVEDEQRPGGFILPTLATRYPQLDAVFQRVSRHVTKNRQTQAPATLNITYSPLTGFSIVQRLSQHMQNQTSRFDALCDMVLNFPAHAAAIAETFDQSSETSRRDLSNLQHEARMLQEQHSSVVQVGVNTMFVNGRELATFEYSTFAVMKLMRAVEEQEDRLIAALAAIVPEGITSFLVGRVEANYSSMQRVIRYARQEVRRAAKAKADSTPGMKGGDSGEAYSYVHSRIHINEDFVFWLNDIEDDVRFEQLPSSIQVMRRSSRDRDPDDTRLPRRNLIHLLFVVDPSTPGGLSGISQALQIVKNVPVPIRVGVVMMQEEWVDKQFASRVEAIDDDEKKKMFQMNMEKVRDEYIPGTSEDDYEFDVGISATNEGGLSYGSDHYLFLNKPVVFSAVLQTMWELREAGEADQLLSFLASLFSIMQEFHESQLDDDVVIRGPLSPETPQTTPLTRLQLLMKQVFHLRRIVLSEDQRLAEAHPDLVSFYVRLRNHLSQSIVFPVYPVILMNGMVLRKETSLYDAVSAEARSIADMVSFRRIHDEEGNLYRAVMREYKAVNRAQSAMYSPITLNMWRGATRTSSWVPQLVSFYERYPFLDVSDLNGVPVQSVVSGVLLLPQEPTLETLRGLLKHVDAVQQMSGVLRLAYLPSQSIFQLLLSVGKQKKEGAGILTAARSDVEKQPRRIELTLLLLMLQNHEESRRSTKSPPSLGPIQAYIKWVLEKAATASFPGATRLTDTKLLTHLFSGKASPLTSSTFAVTMGSLQRGQWFLNYILQQAEVQNPLASALGLGLSVSAEGSATSPLLLVLHGYVIRMEDVELEDVVAVVSRVAPLASTLMQVANKIRFTKDICLNPFSVEEQQAMDSSSKHRQASSYRCFTSSDLSSAFYSARVAMLASILIHTENARTPALLSRADDLPSIPRHSRVMFEAKSYPSTVSTTARLPHSLVLVVDPTKQESQALLALAQFFLHSPIPVSLRVYLNVATTEPTVRSFYQLAGHSRLHFDSAQDTIAPGAAFVNSLPTAQVLTVGVAPPESWMVFSHKAPYDLDNLRLDQIDPQHEQEGQDGTSTLVTAQYRLQSLVLHGIVFTPFREATSAAVSLSAPNGLPLTLTPHDPASQVTTRTRDTLVMASTGYYQLPSLPGLWTLSIQPGLVASHFFLSEAEGRRTFLEKSWWSKPAGQEAKQHEPHAAHRSEDAWRKSNKLSDSEAGQRIPVVVSEFYMQPLLLTYDRSFSHNRLLESVLLDQTRVQQERHQQNRHALEPSLPTLNIFSVASGHLYERFLRMMIHSVFHASTGTKGSRIKFWIIENFLSPQFKAIIPKMAARYGFEIDFVTYRWPWWLPPQSEKQRVIWAYKVLFLDVLFPLDVDRVVYVDADQIARDDLHELARLNFTEGRRNTVDGSRAVIPSIAMTPFCSGRNGNNATTGFRFWEKEGGFWQDHLEGLPYHISAIFVVDLQRFRAMHAGDLYRSTYSQLASDRHSLSNLDQDLPNYLQHRVPIYSLPEEWLWCETWCNEESQRRAKTIDLCNNPLTKVPKLDGAKKIIPEWESTDKRLEALFRLLRSEDDEASIPSKPTSAPQDGLSATRTENDDFDGDL